MSRHYIIPIFVPHFGCPHDCVFCNQKKITGLSTDISPDHVEIIIEEHLKSFKEGAFIEVAFYGGSFTAIDIDIQSQLLSVPYRFKLQGKINEIRLSTRPDAINNKILNNLKRFTVNTIELGCQSLNDQVLSLSDRGHTSDDVYKASRMIKEEGFNLGLQMMLGLPGDTMSKALYTATEFIRLKPDCVRIYPTLVIKETYLEQLYLENKYLPLSLEKSIDITTQILILFYLENINVIRVGLQPTENIQMGKDVIAGPFHPAYRQLVEANIFKLLIQMYLSEKNINTENKTMIIKTNSKNISNIAGQKSSNLLYFKKNYGFKKIKIFEADIDTNILDITIGDFYDKMDIMVEMERFTRTYR